MSLLIVQALKEESRASEAPPPQGRKHHCLEVLS